MSEPSQIKLFISCASKEFRSHRDKLYAELTRHNVFVQVQEDFVAGGVPTLGKLNTYIKSCDAVIHLVGDMTGAAARPHSLATIKKCCRGLAKRLPVLKSLIQSGKPALSYTQWEAFLAIYHNKTLLIAQPTDTAPRDNTFVRASKQIAAQKKHIERLATFDRYPEIIFPNAGKLVNAVLNALVDLLAENKPRAQSKSKPNNLPYPSIGKLFKGRNGFMADLRKSLKRVRGKQSAAIYNAVHGLGGIGKTRLAVEYAWRYEADYTALLFAIAEARAEPKRIAPNAKAVASSAQELRRNLAALTGPLILDLPEQEISHEERRVVAVVRWLLANPGWLLIIDNADTDESAREVEKLLPQLRGGHVLITSRRRSWSNAIERKELGLLEPEDAESFLLEATVSGRQTAPNDAGQVKVVAQELGYLALALEQAAAYIDRHHLSLAGYLTAWRESRDTVVAWYDADTMSYPMSVAVTWQTSVARLRPEARELLNRLAFLSPEPIPASLLDVPVPGVSKADSLAALGELSAYSLVTWSRGAPTFTVHRLVQDVTRRSLPSGEYSKVLRAQLAQIHEAFGGLAEEARNWPRLDALAPHARAVTQHADAAKIAYPTGVLLSKLGVLLRRIVSLGEVESLFQRALTLCKRLTSAKPENQAWKHDLAICYLRVGGLLIAKGDLPAALKALRICLTIESDLAQLAPDDRHQQRSLAVAHCFIGNALAARGSVGDALRSYSEFNVIIDKIAKADPSVDLWQRDLSISYEKIGNMHLAQGLFLDAMRSYQSSLSISRSRARADPEDVIRQNDLAVTYMNVGDVFLAQGKRRNALASFRDCHAIATRLARTDPSNVLWQIDLAESHKKLASAGDKPIERWRLVVEMLRKLQLEGKLTVEQAKWLPEAERRLEELKK